MSELRPGFRAADVERRLNLTPYLRRKAEKVGLLRVAYSVGASQFYDPESVERLLRGEKPNQDSGTAG